MSRFLEATASDWYEPAARFGHVAAAIDEKLYVWGGFKKDMPEVHGGTCVVDILDLQVYITTPHVMSGGYKLSLHQFTHWKFNIS